jgi:hypothetical protein
MTPFVRAVLLLAIPLAMGCAGAGDPDLLFPIDAGAGDALPASCNPPQLTYANFGQAFLTKYCNSCHGFTQQNVQSEPMVLIDVAVTSTYMPPSTTAPSPTERMELGTWLTCGAP